MSSAEKYSEMTIGKFQKPQANVMIEKVVQNSLDDLKNSRKLGV